MEQPRATFEAVVAANQYAVLATADASGRPWASPVWYATADARDFFWVSRPTVRHSRNLAVRAELAITVFDSRQAIGTGQGAYLAAVGALVPDDDLDDALDVFSAASARAGGRPWGRAEVTPPAPLRLYRATALECFVLGDTDERVPVPPSVDQAVTSPG